MFNKKIFNKNGYSQEQAEQKVKWRRSKNPHCDQYQNLQKKKDILERSRLTLLNTFHSKPQGYYMANSPNFYKIQHLPLEERIKYVRQHGYCKDNPNFYKFKNSLTIQYYLNKGYSQLEAQQLLKERQTTFSLKKCIEKYGEELGKQIFLKRQEKWKKSLDTQENQEKLKAGRIKGYSNAKTKNWSKISQKLFNEILSLIDLSQYNVFYHDLNEQFVVLTKNSFRFLDFYIQELNFAIEFDGQYWHRNQTQQQKNLRDLEIKNVLTNIIILHIKERDYINNKKEILENILKLIKEKINECS